ncbi:MAG: DUF342 domain-containing protein [Phycisphaera sp.]|nr:DUF342 domain-containing protein [Phycisphaera sp.]
MSKAPAVQHEASVRVVVASDQSVAELVIPPGFPRAMITPAFCQGVIRQAGVDVTQATVDALEALLSTPLPDDKETRTPIAWHTLPVDGEDGWIEWSVEARCDKPVEKQGHEVASVSHYDRCAYIFVKPGQVLGKLHQATTGTDGRDVLGRVIKAKPGKQVRYAHDESILRDSKAQLIAQEEGVLWRDGDRFAIRRMIEVDRNVDFSTGNIEFNGDVVINKGVRDCFVVKATGKVEVHGLIEAATVECGGDLVASGGFAGRERGHASVGGSMTARYINNIEARVDTDLIVEREVINCHLVVGHDMKAPHGSLIGGDTQVDGVVEVGTLGSPGNVPTRLVLGKVPKLESVADSLSGVLGELTVRRDNLDAQRLQIINTSRKNQIATQDKERLTEIMFELSSLNKRINDGYEVLEALRVRIHEKRTIDLRVGKQLHQGVVIEIFDKAFKIIEDVRGPLQVKRENGEIVYQKDQSNPSLLAKVSEVRMAG